MLQMAKALDAQGAAGLFVHVHACTQEDHIARATLRKLAMLALPLGIKIAYEGLSWGRTVSNEFTTAWDVVCRADCPNLGIGIDSYHVLAARPG